MKIAFIGAGRMAEALITRLKHHQIVVADISPVRIKSLQRSFRVKAVADNVSAYHEGEVVILAVKPQQLAEVLAELKVLEHHKKKLVISIAAGIPLAYLQKKLPGAPLVRAMPNNPCLVGAGITALARDKYVTRAQLAKAIGIFQVVGEVVEVPEKLMNAVTGLSGSGPAFIYQIIEALVMGGIKAGLPKTLAERLALETTLGAALTVKKTGREPGELCAMVTSPGGTTIEGLAVLKKFQTNKAFAAAVLAAARKSRTLSRRWAV